MPFIAKLGYMPDPPKKPADKPDLEAGLMLRAAPPPPPAADIRPLIVDVLNQGSLGSCVANAILQAVRASHVKQGVADPKLGSRLFGYWFSRAYHHQTGEDSGTFLRLFFQSLTKFGFCPESVWPYSDDSETFKKMPPFAALRAAFDQANPTVYRRITATGADRLDQIKRAIASGYAVVFGTSVDSDFCSNKLVEPLLPPRSNIVGGHALLVGGYDGNAFQIVNSWSADWGDAGWCVFSGDYLADVFSNDFWIVERAPRYSEE
jgi:C1A family cysteine protease